MALKTSKAKKKGSKVGRDGRTATRPVRKVEQTDSLDRILLRLSAKPYNEMLKKIESGKKRLDQERRVALELGSRILLKAQKVRDSIMSSTKKPR